MDPDHSSTSIVLTFLMEAVSWRRYGTSIENRNVKFNWSDMHLIAVHDYFIKLSHSCDFNVGVLATTLKAMLPSAEPTICANVVASFTQELHQLFRVPTLKMFIEMENRIKKHQLIRVFLTFLCDLLYHKTDSLDMFKYQIEILEKELRFLVTFLGDKSLSLQEEEEFQNLMAEFEKVANIAGSFIHFLLCFTHQSFGKIDAGFAAVLNLINLLKDNYIMRFLNLLPCTSKTAAYTNSGTSMVDLLVLYSLISDLEDLISREEDNPIADVNDQIKVLHHGLTFLQSFIKDVGQPSENEELKEALARIGNMAHQTEYLIVSFLTGDAPIWYLMNRLSNINQKIELVGVELQEITEKHKLGDFKVAEESNSTQDNENIEIDEAMVGFKDREIDVLDYLIGGRESLQVISTFGMPGLGKTTLTKKLFNHPSINTWFDKKSWCVVSQKYQSQSILAEVLTQINGEFGKERTSRMDSKSLVVHIHKTLYRRKYLIVLDDVWDTNLLDGLMRCFPDDGNGSRILFTTRNKDVCPSNCKNYALSPLLNEECWELLKKKVFGNNTCPRKLIGVGKKIVAYCWGLPLAVVSVAGVLSTMDKEVYLWEKVEENLASYVFGGGDNSVIRVLELSYKHLPQRLKPCFLYFRLFKYHKEIQAEKLMRLWISEGFIHKEVGKSAEDVAEEYLTELIDKSLVMVSKRRSDGRVKTCILHDLLYDLCCKICEDENFLKIEESNIRSVYENDLHHQQTFEEYKHMSIWSWQTSWKSLKRLYERGLVQPLFSKSCITWSYSQQVRSLHADNQRSPIYVGRMRLLRILHYCSFFNHLTGIENLVNLRYLVIRDLPASIGSLVKLEYLRVFIKMKVCLPPEIFRMMKLRYLSADHAIYGEYIESFRTNNLEFLSNISIRKPQDEEMLKYSPNLRKLKCEYKCEPPSSNFDLCFLSRLESLKIVLHGSGLMRISFPSSIKQLSLYGWHDLPCEMMSVIGRLEKLEVLKLGCLKGFEGDTWNTREGEFQKLKFLKLDQLQDLTEWNVESSSHFPVLQRLILVHCENLVEIPEEIGEIATLQLIEIKGRCTESLVESAKVVQQQQLDVGNEELRVLITNTY